MPPNYLVDFISRWISDPALRQAVLYKEETELTRLLYTGDQIRTLTQLKRADILGMLLHEIEHDLGIDVEAVRRIVWPDPGDDDDPDPSAMLAAAGYEETHPHVRIIDPQNINDGQPSEIEVRGHGWDTGVRIEFVSRTGQIVVGQRLSFTSDIDIWQRARVRVTLGPANSDWQVRAVVPGRVPHDTSTEPVMLHVD